MSVRVELLIDRSPCPDHLYDSGVTWAGKGDVQVVPDDKWPLMKRHYDMWREVDESTARSDAKPEGKAVEQEAATPLTAADLAGKTDDELRAIAKGRGIAIHHKKTGQAIVDVLLAA